MTPRARLAVPITVRINQTPENVDENERSNNTVSMPFEVRGPADVVGIDPRAVVRTEPRHLTPDYPPNLFASVEFDRPDFPWLFTPAVPDPQNRLPPWIVLVVVRKNVGTITVDPGRPLPRLTCPATELPDLAEAALWAHAVFVGALGSIGIEAQLAASPDQAISRLVCPRKLQPSEGGVDVGYYACVVPAFEVGRKAGLSEPITTTDLEQLLPAWQTAASAAGPRVVDLPVYYQWEFSTGALGDFEDAVDRLELRDGASGGDGGDSPPHDPASREMDVSSPGCHLEFPSEPLQVPSALRPIGAKASGGTFAAGDALRDVLEGKGKTCPVAPPIYGRMHVSGGTDAGAVLEPGQVAPWLTDLNLNPRHRVAAALGAQVVQSQQEALVASAWEQAGEAERVNQWLRQKRLAREVAQTVVDRRLAPLSSGTLRQILGPVADASEAEGEVTGQRAADRAAEPRDPLAEAVLSSTFRRLARPRKAALPASATARLAASALTRLPVNIEFDRRMSTLVAAAIDRPAVAIQVAPPVATGVLAQFVSGTPSSDLTAGGAEPTPAEPTPTPTPSEAKDPLAGVNPRTTFGREATARVRVSGVATAETLVAAGDAAAINRRGAREATAEDDLAPVTLTPIFPQPMYEPLRDLFADALLPGLSDIPNNTLMLLAVDPSFIESYMVGLNDEMNRELLWREFPADLRGTYFRQFWDVRGQLPPDAGEAEREPLRDIPLIEKWVSPLGKNMLESRASILMLLLKGDLLMRFPSALIYASKARWEEGRQIVADPAERVFPQLRLSPMPGVMLLGFNLRDDGGAAVTRDTVAGAAGPPGGAGWFFVFEEHPTEPRFGLDMSRRDATASGLTSWRELTWPDVDLRADGSRYIAVAAKTPVLAGPPPADGSEPPSPVNPRLWNRDAAAMAYITLQKPFRREVHAGYWFGSQAAARKQHDADR
jgi:hypothetical protein